MTQQQPNSMRPSARPGRMTSVMRSVSNKKDGPKILRIGVVQGGKVVEEQLIKSRTTVTIGPNEKSTFTLNSASVPSQFKLFELVGSDYYLNYLDGMRGRVALKTGVSDLNVLRSQAKVVQGAKGNKYFQVPLTEDARGKVTMDGTTFLFQFVVPPPVQPKPQLPVSVRKGFAGDIDWFTTIVASFSFLLHFFLVASVYSDWMDPVVDDEVTVRNLVQSVDRLPPPPPLEKPKADVSNESKDKNKTETKTAKAATPRRAKAGKGAAKNTGSGKKDPGASRGEKQAKAAELASELAELDVGTLGSLGSSGPATEGVLDTGEVPAGLIDEAGRSERGAGSGDPGGLKGMGGSGKAGTGPLGGGNGKKLSEIGDKGQSGGKSATSAAKTKKVQGPKGRAIVGGAGVGGGKIANASSVVARMRGRFKACYQAGLRQNPEMAGSVSLVATIGPNGEVRGVSGGGGGGLGAIVGCLKAVVRSGAFAPPEGGSAVVSIPITFVKQ